MHLDEKEYDDGWLSNWETDGAGCALNPPETEMHSFKVWASRSCQRLASLDLGFALNHSWLLAPLHLHCNELMAAPSLPMPKPNGLVLRIQSSKARLHSNAPRFRHSGLAAVRVLLAPVHEMLKGEMLWHTPMPTCFLYFNFPFLTSSLSSWSLAKAKASGKPFSRSKKETNPDQSSSFVHRAERMDEVKDVTCLWSFMIVYVP